MKEEDKMKGKGPRSERETVIRFDEDGTTATVWTSSEPIYRKLRKLGYIPARDNERSASFEVPKRDVRLPRPKRVPSKKALEHLKKLRESKMDANISSGTPIEIED